MVKQRCGYLNVCVYYSTSMENNYFYFWAKKGPPDLFSTPSFYIHVAFLLLDLAINLYEGTFVLKAKGTCM